MAPRSPFASIARRQSAAALLVTFVAPLAAQCEPRWQPGEPTAWLSGAAYTALSWDLDGSGPSPALLVVGGTLWGGSLPEGCVAAWDGLRWQALGTPPGEQVTALTVHAGRLVAALTQASGPGLRQTVASFDGSTWQSLGAPGGVNGVIQAFAEFQGALVAGGSSRRSPDRPRSTSRAGTAPPGPGSVLA